MTYKLLQSLACIYMLGCLYDLHWTLYIHMCTLILKLIRSTTIILDKLSEYVCADTLQRVATKQKKKQQKIGMKNFLWKLTKRADGHVKSTETRQEWNTRRLPYYRKMMEKKDKIIAVHLLSDTVMCNRCRVVFLSTLHLLSDSVMCNRCRVVLSFFHHFFIVGQSSCVSFLPCFCTFYRFIPTCG